MISILVSHARNEIGNEALTRCDVLVDQLLEIDRHQAVLPLLAEFVEQRTNDVSTLLFTRCDTRIREDEEACGLL